jgi:hypothetical protein
MNNKRAMMPAIMFSISFLKFFAEADVKSADDEEENDDPDENNVRHRIWFWFCPTAAVAGWNSQPSHRTD